jgi:hypothetical protein
LREETRCKFARFRPAAVVVRMIELLVMPILEGISKKDTDEKVWQDDPWNKRGKV